MCRRAFWIVNLLGIDGAQFFHLVLLGRCQLGWEFLPALVWVKDNLDIDIGSRIRLKLVEGRVGIQFWLVRKNLDGVSVAMVEKFRQRAEGSGDLFCLLYFEDKDALGLRRVW